MITSLRPFAFSLIALLVADLHAQTADKVVSVDFNVGNSVTFIDNYNPTPNAPVGGAYWNGFNLGSNFQGGAFTSSGVLQASDNLTNTTVGFSVTFDSLYNEMRYPGNANYTTSLLEDFAISNTGNTRQLTITGLQANSQYDLYLYSINARYGSTTTTFTVDAAYTSGNALIAKTVTNAGDNTTFTSGVNYTAFSSITSSALKSDATGTLVINWSGVSGPGSLNGFQLVLPATSTIPESSTYAVFAGLVAITLVGWNRRRVAR